MCRGTLLDAPSSSPFSTPFPPLAPSPTTSPSLLYPSASPSTATLQGRLLFGPLAEQFPLTDCEPKSLIDVSSEHTPINLHSRKGSLDTNLDELATTVDASEIYDATDVGQFASPLFPRGRETSALPTSASGSQAQSSVGRPMRDVGPFSSVGQPVRNVQSFSSFEKWLSKGKRNRELESVHLSQMEKEVIVSEQRNIHEFKRRQGARDHRLR